MPRVTRSSIATFLALVAGLAVVVGAVLGIRHFERIAHHSEDTIQLLTEIRGDVNARNAQAWRAIAQGRVGRETIAEFNRQSVELTEKTLRLPPNANAGEILRTYKDYDSAVELELRYLAAGQGEQAREVDESQVDPSFEQFGSLIAAATAQARINHGAAARGQGRATWAIGGASMLLIVGLLGVTFRMRQRAAVDLAQRRALQSQVVAAAALATEREYEANHDLLTGLPNRRNFLRRLDEEVARLDPTRTALAVMLIDLNQFKDVNDTLGHRAGDEVLSQVGPRLQAAMRGEDLLARLGGDEFALLVPVSEAVTEREARSLADRVHQALEASFLVEGLPLSVTSSIGIAIGPDHGVEAEVLLQRADVAMYLAKENGLGTVVYAPDTDTHSREQLELAGQLRAALADDEIVLHYQPKINLESGDVIGVEALARWQHPVRGLLVPAQFLPIVERAGLMRKLTSCVLEQALAQVAEWERDGLSLRVAVNLSVADLVDDGLPDEIAGVLVRHGVDGTQLQLEVTENVFLTAPERVTQIVTRLAANGVTLSLDDFGAGYSSLAHLRRLCVDELKIDRSFVTNIVTDAFDAAVVRSTVGLGHSLSLRVVAEGVETEATLDELREHGCDEAQGYHIRRPAPAAELTPWLRAHLVRQLEATR